MNTKTALISLVVAVASGRQPDIDNAMDFARNCIKEDLNCSQCGQRFTDRVCGFGHLEVRAALCLPGMRLEVLGTANAEPTEATPRAGGNA
jgi:hypothetical protein